VLEPFIGQKVVVDLKSPYVCLGTLVRFDEHFLEMKNADLHDLRDTDTTRENYVAASKNTGVKRNRRSVLIVRADMVALSRLEDVVEK
jgi:small nuclear ribonucleoprotein (snRNP)-like protein